VETGRRCASLPLLDRVKPTRFSAMTKAAFHDDYQQLCENSACANQKHGRGNVGMIEFANKGIERLKTSMRFVSLRPSRI
jgi:hypothetical protein